MNKDETAVLRSKIKHYFLCEVHFKSVESEKNVLCLIPLAVLIFGGALKGEEVGICLEESDQRQFVLRVKLRAGHRDLGRQSVGLCYRLLLKSCVIKCADL